MCLPPPGDTPAYKIAYWDEAKDLGVSALYLKDHARGGLRNHWATLAGSTPYTATDAARHKAARHFQTLLEENLKVQTRIEELEELAKKQKARHQQTKGAALTGTGQSDEQPSVLPAIDNRLSKPGLGIWERITVSAQDPFEMVDQQFPDGDQDGEKEYPCMSESHTALLDKTLDGGRKDPASLDGKKRKPSDETTQIDTRRRAFVYFAEADGGKRQKLNPLESKPGQKRKFVDEIIEPDARCESSADLDVPDGSKRRKLGASEPKANENGPPQQTKAEDQPPSEPQSRLFKVKKPIPRSEWKKRSNKQDALIGGYHDVKAPTLLSQGPQQPVARGEGAQPQAGNIRSAPDKRIEQQEATPPPTPTSIPAKILYSNAPIHQPAHENAERKGYVDATTFQASSSFLPSPPRSPSYTLSPEHHPDCSNTLRPPSGETEERELALEGWMNEVKERIEESKDERAFEEQALLSISGTSPVMQRRKRSDDIRPVRMSSDFDMFVFERISRWEARSTPQTHRCPAQEALLESGLNAEPIPWQFAHEISAKVRLDVSSCRRPFPFFCILTIGARVHGHRSSSTLGMLDGKDLSRIHRVRAITGRKYSILEGVNRTNRDSRTLSSTQLPAPFFYVDAVSIISCAGPPG